MKLLTKGKLYVSMIKLSFAALVMTVLVILIIFISGVRYNLKVQIENTNESMYRQVALNIDNLIVKSSEDIVHSIVYQFPDFKSTILRPLNGNQIEYISLIDYLNGITKYNSQIASVYVVSKQTNLLVSNNGARKISNQNEFADSLFDKLEVERYHSFWISAKESGAPKETAFSYVKTFVPERCAVIINIDKKYMEEYFQNFYTGDSANYFLTDKNQDVIVTNDTGCLFKPLEEVREQKFKRSRFILQTPLSIADWDLISSIDEKLYLGKWDFLFVLLIFIGTIILITVLTLVKKLTDKIYGPLNEVTMKARGIYPDQNIKEDASEDKVIGNAISFLSQKVDSIEKIFSDNIQSIQNNILRTLLYKNFNSEMKIREKLENVGKKFNGEFFQVIIFKIDDYKYMSNRMYSKNCEVIKMDINRIIQEGLHDRTEYLIDEVTEGQFTCLLNFNNIDLNLSKLLKNIQKETHKEYGVTLSIAIGSIVFRLEDVSLSHSQAKKTLCYTAVFPKESLLTSISLNNDKFIKEETIEDSADRICEIIKSDKVEELSQFCHDLLHDFVRSKYTIESIEFALKKLIILVNVKFGIVFSYEDIINTNDNMDNIDQTILTVTSKLSLCYTYYYKDKENQVPSIIESIKNYIDQNIGGDVSLKNVSNEFYISVSQLSKIFKENMNITFNDYVISVRIQRAKELLEKRMKVIDVTMTLGYSSPAYFIKQFKKIVGMTPKQYQISRSILVDNDIDN